MTSEPLPKQRAAPGLRRLSQAGLIVVALIFLFPFFWMISNALRADREVFTIPPRLFPSQFQWHNFVESWLYLPFGRFFLNSAFVALSITLITLVVSCLSAYAFARLRFPGRGTLFVLYLATLMVPQAVIVIPLFLMMGALDWIDTYQALIIPVAFSSFGTFLLRQFFLSIPIDLEEAALLDGAGHWVIYSRIILPLARPAIAALLIFAFLGSWNGFLWPLVVVDSEAMKTLPLGIIEFQGQYTVQWNLLMAGAALSVLPVLLVYLVAQRYIVEGIALTGQGGR